MKAKFTDKATVCPQCGVIRRPAAAFCYHCGHQFQTGRANDVTARDLAFGAAVLTAVVAWLYLCGTMLLG